MWRSPVSSAQQKHENAHAEFGSGHLLLGSLATSNRTPEKGAVMSNCWVRMARWHGGHLSGWPSAGLKSNCTYIPSFEPPHDELQVERVCLFHSVGCTPGRLGCECPWAPPPLHHPSQGSTTSARSQGPPRSSPETNDSVASARSGLPDFNFANGAPSLGKTDCH